MSKDRSYLRHFLTLTYQMLIQSCTGCTTPRLLFLCTVFYLQETFSAMRKSKASVRQKWPPPAFLQYSTQVTKIILSLCHEKELWAKTNLLCPEKIIFTIQAHYQWTYTQSKLAKHTLLNPINPELWFRLWIPAPLLIRPDLHAISLPDTYAQILSVTSMLLYNPICQSLLPVKDQNHMTTRALAQSLLSVSAVICL